jgi:hypothetical protein
MYMESLHVRGEVFIGDCISHQQLLSNPRCNDRVWHREFRGGRFCIAALVIGLHNLTLRVPTTGDAMNVEQRRPRFHAG